jgi:hypothetical protein
MKIGVSVSLDVTKIDKARLTEVKKKDGSTAVYLNMTTFIDVDQKDQYENNGFISQSQTKEEREAGEERPPILGNVKVFYTDGTAPVEDAFAPPVTPSTNGAVNEEIPF